METETFLYMVAVKSHPVMVTNSQHEAINRASFYNDDDESAVYEGTFTIENSGFIYSVGKLVRVW
jgi:hypothetical protein